MYLVKPDHIFKHYLNLSFGWAPNLDYETLIVLTLLITVIVSLKISFLSSYLPLNLLPRFCILALLDCPL
jgi:hypothetical protein